MRGGADRRPSLQDPLAQRPTTRRSRSFAPGTACWLLLLLAVLHGALGVHEGLFDGGDYSLVLLGLPMMTLTASAAVVSLARASWLSSVPVVLTSISLALSVALLGVYGVGLFHLPQSALALAVALATARR